MPQIASIQLPAQAPAPSPSGSSSESSAFAPHLEQALKNRNPESASASSEKGNGSKEFATNATKPRDEGETPSADGEGAGKIDLLIEKLLLFAGDVQQDTPSNPNQPVNLGQAITALLNTPASDEANGTISNLLNDNAANKAFLDGEIVAGQQGQTAQSLILQQKSLVPATSENHDDNPLLQQLQRIIDSGEEDVAITITASGKTTRLATNGGAINLQTDTLPQRPIEVVASAVTSQASDVETPYIPIKIEMAGEQPPAPVTRHSLQQQYLESKMTVDTTAESETGGEDSQQQQNSATTAKSGLFTETAAATASSESPSAFSQPLAQAQEGLKPLSQDISRPVTLPSGTTVHQEEVIRQIAERFTITPRDGNTRVNLQLHPAELGELRIDLTVKNGTVRANVIASTQVSQEIIEKNMPRLRSILENQGFTIDELLVSNNSRTIDDFNLFDQHLFGNNDSSSPSSQQGGKSAAVFTLDGSLTQDAVATGVNVQI